MIRSVREALAKRIEAFFSPLSYPVPHSDEPRAPFVYRQFQPVENDDMPDAPCAVVHISDWTQDGDTRSAQVEIILVLFAPDSEQGYQDVEMLTERLEADLIANPWLDYGAYHLVGPWHCQTTGMTYELFGGTLECRVELPVIDETTAPDGRAMSEII